MLPRIRILVPAPITAGKLWTRADGMRRTRSIVGDAATQALDLLAFAIVIQAPLARTQGRARRVALFRHHTGACDQLLQARQGFTPVALLGAVIAGDDQPGAVGVQAAACHGPHPRLDRGAKRACAGQVKAQLGGGCDLVDVLAARSRAADELELQILFRDVRDVLHGGGSPWRTYISRCATGMVMPASRNSRQMARLTSERTLFTPASGSAIQKRSSRSMP